MASTILKVMDRQMTTPAVRVGHYKGMQVKIIEVCRSAEFVPCTAHSFILAGQSVVNCCIEAVSLFQTIQEVFNIFQQHVYDGALSQILFRKEIHTCL